MKVRVKLFALAREIAGEREVELELSAEARVPELRAALAARFPALVAALKLSRFAVNADFAGEHAMLRAEDEIALIPPVSGG